MALFEFQRIWDAFPNLRFSELLRDLFRQQKLVDGERVLDVFTVPGHVFVSTSSSAEREEGGVYSLYVFDCVPLWRDPRPLPLQSEDSALLLGGRGRGRRRQARVVDVLDLSDGGPLVLIGVVQGDGKLSSFIFDRSALSWRPTGGVQVSVQAGGGVCGVCVVGDSLVLCERHRQKNYRVVARKMERGHKGEVCVGDPTVVLSRCPCALQVCRWEGGGVCMVPVGSHGNHPCAPRGLLLFWSRAVGLHLKVWSSQANLWNTSCPMHKGLPPPSPSPSPSSSPSSDFKTLVLGTAGIWSKVSDETTLVSIATNTVTNHLLALSSDGTVYQLFQKRNGCVGRRVLNRLSDFTHRYSMVTRSLGEGEGEGEGEGGRGSLPPQRVWLFCVHSYWGLLHQGEVRLYDSCTGEMVWECGDHEPSSSLLPSSPSPSSTLQWVGLVNTSGLWVLRCKKISEHANFLVTSLFPVTTNADETTPGDYLRHAHVLAAQLCALWGLSFLASKYSIEALHRITMGREGSGLLPAIPPQLVSLLTDSSMETPALFVALLGQFPGHRKLVGRLIAQYLKQSRESEETRFESEIAPLLRKHLLLSQQYDALLGKTFSDSAVPVPSVRERVCGVLALAYEGDVLSESGAAHLSWVPSLSSAAPGGVLGGVRDFLGTPCFQKAVEQLRAGQWASERNWRGLLANHPPTALLKMPSQVAFPRVPLFELTCRLLYVQEPQELLHFVEFCWLAREHQASLEAFTRSPPKCFYCQRALDAIPPSNTSLLPCALQGKEASAVRTQLLLQSELPGAQYMALHVLTEHEVWKDAIALLRSVKNENAPEKHCAMFSQLLGALAKHGGLSEHMDELWKEVPARYSVFELLGVLGASKSEHQMKNKEEKEEETQPSVLLPSATNKLSVSNVAPKVLQLLSQSTSRGQLAA